MYNVETAIIPMVHGIRHHLCQCPMSGGNVLSGGGGKQDMDVGVR